MKNKELIERLQSLDPEKDVCYECMMVDYASDHQTHIDMGGTHINVYCPHAPESVKKDLNERYRQIVESDWFKKAYMSKSLGGFTWVDNEDAAAELFNSRDAAQMWDYDGKTSGEIVEAAFKAGVRWALGQLAAENEE